MSEIGLDDRVLDKKSAKQFIASFRDDAKKLAKIKNYPNYLIVLFKEYEA